MTSWHKDLREMHDKFGISVRDKSPDLLRDFLAFRIAFLREELDELGSATTADDAVDALVDLCVVAVGTLDLYGVDVGEAWRRVMAANSSKMAGSNPRRPSPFGHPDLVKPEGWVAPSHADNVGLLSEVFPSAAVRETADEAGERQG